MWSDTKRAVVIQLGAHTLAHHEVSNGSAPVWSNKEVFLWRMGLFKCTFDIVGVQRRLLYSVKGAKTFAVS